MVSVDSLSRELGAYTLTGGSLHPWPEKKTHASNIMHGVVHKEADDTHILPYVNFGVV